MKISIIVSDISGAGAGRWGGAVRSFLLAQALQSLQHEVEILGFIFDGQEGAIIPQSSIQVKHITGYKYPRFLKSAANILKEINGDIIYAMRPKPTTFGLGLLKRISTKQPIILDIDDWELSWYGGEEWRYRPSLKQLYRDIFKSDGALRYPDHPLYIKTTEGMTKKADAITIHTKFLQQKFGGVYIPNGKDVELFNPHNYDSEKIRVDYGLSGYRILMFPGAPRPYKGVEDVLMALDLLNEQDLKLVIVGGSPYDEYDAQLIEKWGRWIIKLPKVPVTEMPKIVSAAHAVVVPQRNTPAALAQFPLKLTDGMAMAKPILATRVGDIPEILGETGYLADPSSPEQIAEQIKLIFQDLDAANERGIKARQRCVEKYSLQAMAQVLKSVLASV